MSRLVRLLPTSLGLLSLLTLAGPARAEGWETEGHDARRTGQSTVVGPRSPGGVVSVALADGQAINMPPAVARNGRVFAGTWGVIRSFGLTDRAQWDKSDGKLYAFHSDLTTAWPQPFAAERTPYCYLLAGRAATPGQCPGGGTVSYYNGTVEGTPALSADGTVLYVGRGDGKLYAVDVATGSERWSFATFNPALPGDPDGGGEVIAAPLVGPDGAIYLATTAAGPYETNAVYAVNPDGTLRWRYPSAAASFPNIVAAAPALAPDGRTLYVAGAWGPAVDAWDTAQPGFVLAFDLAAGASGAPLKWMHELRNPAEPGAPLVWTTALAVGSDGRLYGSGPMRLGLGFSAVLYALDDRGDHAELAWPRMVDLDRGRTSFTLGLALREVGGVTTRVYASSGNVFTPLFGYRAGGKLYAVDPASGALDWPAPFDPEAHGGTGAMTGIALDAEGVLYTGVSGHLDGGLVFAIAENGALLWSLPLAGLLEWGHPVLGPAGELYVAETRRSACTIFPLESGACNGVDIAPRLYALPAGGGTAPCVADGETLCLRGGRFEVKLRWSTADGATGVGQRVAGGASDDAGLLWFFRASNWEMLVKVLDGCAVNGHHWVFYAATTNVGFTLRVRDTTTGAVREYVNPVGRTAAPRADTAALDGC